MPYPNTSSTALFEAEKDGGFEVGVTPIPGTKEGKTSTFLGGDAMGISKDCKHVAQAWNFLAWLMSDDAQKEVFAANGDTASNIQTLKTAYDDADPRVQTINSVIIDGNGQTPKSAAFNEAFNAAGSPPIRQRIQQATTGCLRLGLGTMRLHWRSVLGNSSHIPSLEHFWRLSLESFGFFDHKWPSDWICV